MADPIPSHAERVAAKFPPHTIAHTAALFHDHIEDDLGPVPAHVRDIVGILSRRDGEDYFAYIERICDSGNGVAWVVKLADLEDNLARCRGEFGGVVNPKRAKRYRRASGMLGATWSHPRVRVERTAAGGATS